MPLLFPLLVGTGFFVLEPCGLVDKTLDCEVVGEGTKVLIGGDEGEGGV